MAGGAGTRLRPLTIGRLKPMIPLVNQAVIAHILALLRGNGITDVIVTVHSMNDVIQEYFGSGRSIGMNIEYSVEETPLGTAGCVKNAQKYLDDTFLVISGDALTDFHLKRIIDYHHRKSALATITLYRVPNPLDYGLTVIDENGRIIQFLEKPTWHEVISDTVNTGIYVLEPEVLEQIAQDTFFDFAKDVFPHLLATGAPLYGYVAQGYWCDIGNINEYVRASRDVLNGIVQVNKIGRHIGGGITAAGEVEVAPDAQLFGPIFLGEGVKIKKGVIIQGPSVIRDYTVLDNHARVDRSIIWRNSYIGENTELRGAVIGRSCNIKNKAVVFEGAVIGDSCVIGEGATIHSGVKIWPNKEIEIGATVTSSIIWAARGRRVLFGRYGVSGLVNVDMTPEDAAKLGAAFAATMPINSMITVNRDPHRSSRMLKRAIIAGLPSAGVNANDLRNVPIPVAHYYTRISNATGGIHVRVSPFDSRVVDVRFFDGEGLNISNPKKREIERIYFREDFRRVFDEEIGTIDYAPDVSKRYFEHFVNTINVKAIRKAEFHLAVDYANSPTSTVMTNILKHLHCRTVTLNGTVDETRMAIEKDELEQEITQLARIVSALDTNLGVRLDVGGERIFLIDERGQILRSTQACAVMAELALRQHPEGIIAIAVHQPTIFEQIAARHGGKVIRTVADINSAARDLRGTSVIMAGDGKGGFIFPEFQWAMDGLMATAKLLEFLAQQKAKLSEIVASLPPYHMALRSVTCPWEAKGKVMRLLNGQYAEQRSNSPEGIKIDWEDEWVLLITNPDKPSFSIFAESTSDEAAQTLADEFAGVLEELQE